MTTVITWGMRRYAAEILRLQEDSDQVALADLTEQTDVSPQAVTRMVRRLRQAGLVDHAPYRGVRLTAAGVAAAMPALRRHRLVEVFLVRVMGFGWHEVHDHAEVLERGISDGLEERIDEMAGRPTRCPHGEPIPTRDGQLAIITDMRLTEVATGFAGQVSRVRTHDPDRLRYLEELGLTPGASITVLGQGPFSGPVRLKVHGPEIVLGAELAREIMVHEAGSTSGGKDLLGLSV